MLANNKKSRQSGLVASATLNAVIRNLSATGRGRKQVFGIIVDSSIIMLSLWAAFSLRLGTGFTDIQHTWHLFVLLPPIGALSFAGFGVYHWIVRSSNVNLFIQLAKASLVSSVTLLALLYLFPPVSANPRSLFIIYALILFSSTCLVRMAWRGFFDSSKRGMPIAIYGAGSAGVQLAASLESSMDYRPVCFIDDEKSLKNSMVMGLPVFYSEQAVLGDNLARFEVSQVVIAIPSLDSSQYEFVFRRAESLGIPFKTLPGIAELVSGQSNVNEFRDISIADILGRAEVLPDPTLLKQCVRGRCVLVTGGGGSIGSELCRQIVKLSPTTLVVVDNCEANLYAITEEIDQIVAGEPSLVAMQFVPVLCSVNDRARIRQLLENYPVDAIYHAAAYKHVPIVERFPGQAIDVNVLGTLNMVESAIEARVRTFMLISTDKAVRPTNAMGASKRVAELILQAKAQLNHETTISMVRFGNVLGSSGSVVPKFRKQIKEGGPVTITHSDITRYFMTIPEASQLVLQASAIARGGEVFVLDMGEPVAIRNLAETMIRLHRRRTEMAGGQAADVQIKVIGLRPGEKMYEELFIDGNIEETLVPKVLMANECYLEWAQLEPMLNELKALPVGLSPAQLKGKLLDLISHPALTKSAESYSEVGIGESGAEKFQLEVY